MIGVSVSQIILRNFFGGGLIWGEAFNRTLVLSAWLGNAGAHRSRYAALAQLP